MLSDATKFPKQWRDFVERLFLPVWKYHLYFIHMHKQYKEKKKKAKQKQQQQQKHNKQPNNPTTPPVLWKLNIRTVLDRCFPSILIIYNYDWS